MRTIFAALGIVVFVSSFSNFDTLASTSLPMLINRGGRFAPFSIFAAVNRLARKIIGLMFAHMTSPYGIVP
jgi:branched-subunit amino acid transport protein